MRPRISYFSTSSLWLHLEDFTNLGITPEQAEQVIRSIPDPGSSTLNLSCEPMRINHNWIVRTMSCQPGDHEYIVATIESRLRMLLAEQTPA